MCFPNGCSSRSKPVISCRAVSRLLISEELDTAVKSDLSKIVNTSKE